jgi:hydrogenase maturation factor
MKDDLNYIIEIFRISFPGDIIKQDEYRNHLMIITNNCNDHIVDNLPIDTNYLEDMKIKKEEEIRAKNTITGYNGEEIYINDTTDLNIKFDDVDNTLTYEQVFVKYNLLNKTYNNKIFMISSVISLYTYDKKTFYVKINKNFDNDKFDIIDIKTKEILNDEPFHIVEVRSENHKSIVATYNTYRNFTSIAIINDNVKEENYNIQHGGYAKSSKFKTKEILGKLRRIYKIPNSKKEHIKHKGNLITVSEYKAVMKLKNKIYK